MPLDLSQLEAEVSRNESVDGSAAALLTALFAEVESVKNNPAAIQAIVDRVRTANDSLAAAVLANTPGATDTPGDTPGEPGTEPPAARRR